MSDVTTYIKQIIFLLGDDRRKVFGMIFLFLSSSMLDLAGLGLIGPYITLVINPKSLSNKYLQDFIEIFGLPLEQGPLLIALGLVLLVIFLLKLLAIVFITHTILVFSERQHVRLQSQLMQTFQNLPYRDYLQRNSSEYILSIESHSAAFAGGVVLPGLKTLSDSIVALVIVALLAWTNGPALILLLALLGILIVGYDRVFRRRAYLAGKRSNDASIQLLRGIGEGIEGLKEIRVLGKEKYFHDVVYEGAIEHSRNIVRSRMITEIPRYLLEFLLIGFVVLLVVSAILTDQSLQQLVPTLGMFGVAAMRLVPSTNVVIRSLIDFRVHRNAVSRLYVDLSRRLDQGLESTIRTPVEHELEKFREFSVKNVHFNFPGLSRPTLSDVSISFCAGESIGLIGPSGSGKTTLVDVMLGLLEPQRGQLLFNGHEITDSLLGWRSQVAYLPQQVFLIDDTLRANVALGEKADQIDESRLFGAVRQARLDELIEQLPQGVDTIVGERGVRLSGGQRQRIALARAFYHGRNVLVMDEATSALDNETEQEIVDEIRRLKGQMTTVVIAHRLSTIRYCDRIYYLEGGVIIKEGRYSDIFPTETDVK